MTLLEQIADLRKAVDEYQQDLEHAIRLASADHSLRAIAEAAGMSHESVRRLIRSDQT